ncbi:MAG: Segregation and condensation protein A [Chlamydiales bacterium]|nr:Segregation and condensation protein A [Chlamydiales bacterium]MCH9635648.1 Segregation and condensation protein A [Chlamydiales bacterium]
MERPTQVSEIKENTLDNFSLENFEGPLDLLLFLIQKEEVDITDVELKRLTEQFAEKIDATEIDRGSNWLALTATLLLLKSQKLIPGEQIDEEELPRVEVFQKLLEYCQIKEAATALVQQEEKQRLFFSRGEMDKPKRSSSGLEEVQLEELTELMQEVISRAPKVATIEQEQWEVAPKLDFLRSITRMPFSELFHEKMCRNELVVTFLALLELMKLEEVKVIRDGNIYVESTGC